MAMLNTTQCSLCGHAVHIVTESAPGYQKGQKYTICECEGCLSSFASPLAVDDVIYEHIYKNIKNVPGYNRYYWYAYEVLNQKRALDYLSQQEESYWAIAHHMKKRKSAGERLKVLEIGSGMGYLTHALVKDGFDAIGVDISPQAVAWALEHYGPYYACKTLQDLKARGFRYDAIIMNQIIEHLPNVNTFITEALGLLSRNGELLLTTPNKSAYPDAEWETELPPVHLWWFGEEAMRYLAQRHDCTIMFTDFELFYNSFYRIKTPSTAISSRQPFFDAQGMLLTRQDISLVGPLRRTLNNTGIVTLLRRIRSAMIKKDRWHGAHGPIIAAVMRRTK